MARRGVSLSIAAPRVLELLRARHTRDLFWSEVKDGPTWNGAPMRLDALAIAKSWSPVRLMGYEIKVSRGDWLGDRKWEQYRTLVHNMTIVAAPGVAQPEEIPEGVGLLEVASTGNSLRWVRKSVYREIELPGPLLLYLLMSRTVPGDPHAPRERTRKADLRVLELEGLIRSRCEQLCESDYRTGSNKCVPWCIFEEAGLGEPEPKEKP